MNKGNPIHLVEDGLDFVIFGITGDLAHKKLIPAIFNLYTYILFLSQHRVDQTH